MRTAKQILQVTKWSFIDWLMDIRQLLVFIVLLCISNYTVMPLVHLSEDKGVPMNIVEPFLANINSIYVILVILICWLVLISDYPKMEGNNGYILIRINRMIWLLGKVLAFVLASVFYILELLAVFTVRAAKVCFVADGWSYVMKDFMEKYMLETNEYAIICVVDERLFNHYLPYKAFGKTILLLFGLLCMFGLIMIAASLGKSKMAGLILNLILIIGGFSVLQSGSIVRCLLPVANVLLSTQTTALIRLLPENFSGMYFGIGCILLFVCCVVLVRHGQVEKDGER